MVVVLTFSLLRFKQALNKVRFSLTISRMRVSGSRHTYNFVSNDSGITLLLLNSKSSCNYFVVTEKGFV